jgi:thiol-disulfide isomerase/thioredoxin
MAQFRNAAVWALSLAAVCGLAASNGLAQVNQPKDKREAKKAEKFTKGDKAEKKYPDTPTKKLNAKVDFRNKKAPIFRVEKWLSKEPSRKDKTILIDFWATWCPPCRALVPELIAWQDKYKDDLVIIGVSGETPGEVQPFMKDQKVNYAMAIDTKQKMAKDVGVGGIPHVLVISSDGIVRWQGFPMGEDPLTEEKLVQIIEADKSARAAKLDATKKTKDTFKPDATKDEPAKTDPAKPVTPDDARKTPAPKGK